MRSLKKERFTLSKRGKYRLKGRRSVDHRKTFQANIRGFGFVMLEGEDRGCCFIPGENVNGAFQGDEVECIILAVVAPGGKRKEGKIVSSRSRIRLKKIVGIV